VLDGGPLIVHVHTTCTLAPFCAFEQLFLVAAACRARKTQGFLHLAVLGCHP
jgi:hypothetical protein